MSFGTKLPGDEEGGRKRHCTLKVGIESPCDFQHLLARGIPLTDLGERRNCRPTPSLPLHHTSCQLSDKPPTEASVPTREAPHQFCQSLGQQGLARNRDVPCTPTPHRGGSAPRWSLHRLFTATSTPSSGSRSPNRVKAFTHRINSDRISRRGRRGITGAPQARRVQ